MIRYRCGDIAKQKRLDVIVVPANGVGSLKQGFGIRLAAACGPGFAEEVRGTAMRDEKPQTEGSVFFTSGGLLNKRNKLCGFLHAVMVRYPNGYASYSVLEDCLRAAFHLAAAKDFRRLGVTNLAAGHTNIDTGIAAERTYRWAKEFESFFDDILIVDADERFIDEVRSKDNG